MDVRSDGHLIVKRDGDFVVVESFSQIGDKFPIVAGDVITSVNNRSVELMTYDEGAPARRARPLPLSACAASASRPNPPPPFRWKCEPHRSERADKSPLPPASSTPHDFPTVIDAVFRNPLGLSAIRFVRPVRGRVHASILARVGAALIGAAADEKAAKSVAAASGAAKAAVKCRVSGGSEDSIKSVDEASSEDATSDGGATEPKAKAAAVTSTRGHKRTHSKVSKAELPPAVEDTSAAPAKDAARAGGDGKGRDNKRARSL